MSSYFEMIDNNGFPEVKKTDAFTALVEELKANGTSEARVRAIDISIEHWKFIAEYLETALKVPSSDTYNCALCALFFEYESPSEPFCPQCPISNAGNPQCDDTPHDEYIEAEEDDDVETAKTAANDMLDMLKYVKDLESKK